MFIGDESASYESFFVLFLIMKVTTHLQEIWKIQNKKLYCSAFSYVLKLHITIIF